MLPTNGNQSQRFLPKEKCNQKRSRNKNNKQAKAPHENSPARILRAKSHGSQTSHPQSCIAPMSCDRRQNACWHLRCNTPSEEGEFLWVFFLKGWRHGAWESGRPWHGCNDTQLVRCFGAMLRLFRRLVAHTASARHPRRLEDELADLSDRSSPKSWMNRYSREGGDMAFAARGQVAVMRCKGQRKD